MVTFFLAIGGRSTAADLSVALAIGQRHFLVPAGSSMAEMLRTTPGVRVCLDSGAWPIHNPARLSLDEYAAEILRWRLPCGGWLLDWFAGYDHILDPGRTQRDYARLLGILSDAGAADAPLVPVLHYGPHTSAHQVLLDMAIGHAGTRTDLVDEGTLARPGYAIGGMVPPLSPTSTAAVFHEADRWYSRLLRDLECVSNQDAGDENDLQLNPTCLNLHLFGVARAPFVLRSPLVSSFDSSGPFLQAKHGWQKIRPTYNSDFGFSAEKLQRSRAARVAYWICRYRTAVGLHWNQIDERMLPNDPPRVARPVQHAFSFF